ncbi:hypothetical protein HG536_0A07000 [Torulaspora globosa]|uniref:Uncharacterized protein n=1 Tax=Torulaspora globosa TaxID=48254 RepID=A0A7G3ZBJ9_9SACH|nr:uncharacterized protein HG536_0A07000 [Torulaspora globosa]QLL30885.1 hypothetical protein HG536_0A07000 [Torulaspora globosa]
MLSQIADCFLSLTHHHCSLYSMSSSVVVANIPLSVSDVTLLKFFGKTMKGCTVKHIQPFPDAYHYINEVASTRSVQLFLEGDQEVDVIKKTFEDERTMQQLIEMEKELSSTHQLETKVAASQVRRLSVTTA